MTMKCLMLKRHTVNINFISLNFKLNFQIQFKIDILDNIDLNDISNSWWQLKKLTRCLIIFQESI